MEDAAQAQIVAYEDICYLRTHSDLLRGRLTLGLDGRTYDLPFSTVSKEIIQRLVDLIRPRYTKTGVFVAALEQALAPSGGLSFLFSGLLAKEQRDQRLLAAQAGEAIGWGETSGWRPGRRGRPTSGCWNRCRTAVATLLLPTAAGPLPYTLRRTTPAANRTRATWTRWHHARRLMFSARLLWRQSSVRPFSHPASLKAR